MREEIANLVYPVISQALDLHERLQRDVPVNIVQEQAALRELLLPTNAPENDDLASLGKYTEVRIPTDYLGAADDAAATAGSAQPPNFLGILYGLVCWLDEWFIAQPRCADVWGRQPLEMLFYGRNDRDWKFWEQAQIATTLPHTDALETFYWCVALGFRGTCRDTPEKVSAWVTAAATQIDERVPAWRCPAALEPVVHVPPLSGRRWLVRMLVAAGALLLCLIPAAAFIVARDLRP